MRAIIDIDLIEGIGYIRDMPRPRKDEKRDSTLTVKLPESLYNEIRFIVQAKDRTESYVGYRLIERGLAAYKRDGKLMEEEQKGDIERIQIEELLEDEKTKKRKRA